jgi:hypothetical protein
MSKITRRYQAGVGNIKNDKAYDPFPKSGLVKKYAPFIRARLLQAIPLRAL